jgi:hypothetical protein
MTEGTHVATAENGGPVTGPESQSLTAANLDQEAAWWAAGDEVEGSDLIKDEGLFELVGVPFKAVRATFRDGVQRKDVPYRDDYVSVDLVVAPPAVYKKALSRINSRRASAEVSEKPVAMPFEQLVVNDGSTGFYRQILEYLVGKGHVTLPEGEITGEKGECVYDLPRSQWLTGADEASEGIDVDLNCTRGLRFSEYESEYLPAGQTARTWYIA